MFKRTTRDKYLESLECLPPAYQDGRGFLVGEPTDRRICNVTGTLSLTYDAYMQKGDRYYASVSSMTIAEYRAYKATE
jgi:hypothetical protein